MFTIVHAIIGYFFLLIMVRVLTRRPGAQMTSFEFVIVFLLGGVIILSTVGKDRSEVNCTCAVIVVGLMHRTVALIKAKSPRMGAILDGTPLVLLKPGGAWQDKTMRGMKIDKEDVRAAARTKGIARENDIDYAILERNGGISILKKQE